MIREYKLGKARIYIPKELLIILAFMEEELWLSRTEIINLEKR